MGGGRRGRPAGFSLPLTMALAFSLMALATAIVGMVVVSDRQAKAAASDVVVRATLESAIEASLFGLERDGEPQAREWTDRQALNGLDVELTLQPVRYKPDINGASAATLDAAIADAGLRDRVAAAKAPANATDPRPQFSRFVEFAEAAGADAADEDCLRRRLTIGRKSGEPDPAPAESALIPPKSPLVAGEVIDVRAETHDAAGRRDVLWRRVRFIGPGGQTWLTHDWRELRLPHADIACPAPEPAPSIGGGPAAP